MKKTMLFVVITLSGFAISFGQKSKTERNIKMYSSVWDQIINQGKLELINDANFAPDITMITLPEKVTGITDFKAYYANFLTGFSDIEFTIEDIFGQGDKLVKHWNFRGKHTGEFFGIPASGKDVNINGVTLVKMKNGKILQEQDFMDTMVFMQQLGVLSSPNNLSVIDQAYKAFANGNIPAVLGNLDPNIVWNEAEGNAYADGNPYVGPDAVLNGIFARIGAEYDYFKLVDIQLHDMSNEQVLATLRYNAKLKKNGAVIDAQAAHLWTLKNGKPIGFQQYVDTKQLDDALNK